jgi:hypothetical protein
MRKVEVRRAREEEAFGRKNQRSATGPIRSIPLAQTNRAFSCSLTYNGCRDNGGVNEPQSDLTDWLVEAGHRVKHDAQAPDPAASAEILAYPLRRPFTAVTWVRIPVGTPSS